jgi:diguanylate cyclase (GGDEF)-like protein
MPLRTNKPTVTQAMPVLALKDRAIRALVAVIEDLSIEREQEGLIRSTLEHVVGALATTGGATFLLDADGALYVAASLNLSDPELEVALELALGSLGIDRPSVKDTLDGGWYALAPLVTQGQNAGMLVLRDSGLEGTAPAAPLLEVLGKQIATGLENARVYAELRVSSERTALLNRISASLAAGRDLRTVIPTFAKEIATIQPFERLACAFVNDSGDYIEVVGHPEDTTWGLGGVIPVVGSGPGSVVLNNKAVLQPDLLHSHRFIEDMRLLEEGVRSYVLLPLHARGRAIGVLALGSPQVGAFDELTLARLQPLADAVSLAFENVRLFQRTRELSITDELTPLYNARFFHQILDRELKLVDRYDSVLSLIFVDLDRFKPINDTYGHLRGSRVLREVGFLLRAAVRETDYPARYGGDEFVVILPQTDGPAARQLGEKLRGQIEGHTFLQEEGINAQLGVSLGVATYPTDATTKEALIRLADERMYQDKEQRKAT